ncbi:MAG TPA: hypothetical protein VNX01_04355 [Bacteroidia bacterium]|nr:hypothetical protein [Bacteroidia bacterium]
MKKLLAILLFAASILSVKAQNNYVLTKTGEKIAIMEDWLKLDVNYIAVHVEKKENKKGFESVVYKDKNFKMVEFGGRVFMVLPDGNKEYIQEIICFNDKYILTTWFVGGSDVFMKIFDWDLNSVCKLKQLFAGEKPQKKDIEARIKPYFGDCKNIIDAMYKNVADGKTHITDDLYAVKCNTNKTVNDLIKKFLALPAPTK